MSGSSETKDDDGGDIETAPCGKLDESACVRGLTNDEAFQLLSQWGPNEIQVTEKSVMAMFGEQFVGTMPFILIVCIIISGAVQDWEDFGVILAMLIVNAFLGLKEQLKAADALRKLTEKLISTISVNREGEDVMLPVTMLVPGDLVYLVGGNLVPADVEWVSGDVLDIDTSALTGESLPRKYPSVAHGKSILGGSTVKSGEAYCLVKETGARTEIGRGQSAIAQDRKHVPKSVFEQKVLRVVQVIIIISVLDALVIILVQGFAREEFYSSYKNPLLAGLSILIASVPVALPLVLQVTMAIGASNMAQNHNAIVTRMSALQDIASMEVLCSDKTGTITTAKMTINKDKIVANQNTLACLRESGILAESVASSGAEALLVLAALGSNPSKVDDAIDSSIFRAFHDPSQKHQHLQAAYDEFEQEELTGFNPEYKRTTATLISKDSQKVFVSKGLLNKIIDTSSDGVDDATFQWRCNEEPGYVAELIEADETLASEGYKTIAVAVRVGQGPTMFAGILPMIDPPRKDSAETIKRLQDAGVEVKMITGDHLNIAIETANVVGLGTNIQPGQVTREGTYHRDELVRSADGFAQVLPRDKRECVMVLERSYNLVVGMTGDGVNDAPALSIAQCGIAVCGATDAAKNAASIILTEEGLSAVFGAVVESRKIAARLMAYVTYRLATTIQILIALSVIVLAFDCEINTFYIVLLALLNDLTMVPIAEDRQLASRAPMVPHIYSLVSFSLVLGVAQALFTLIFYMAMGEFLQGNLTRYNDAGYGEVLLSTPGFYCNDYAQTALWLQISISAELLIFSARAPGLFFMSRPSVLLMASTLICGCVLCSILAVYAFSVGGKETPHVGIRWDDVGIIWAYDLACFLFLDLIKLLYKHEADHGTSGVIDEAKYAKESEMAAAVQPESLPWSQRSESLGPLRDETSRTLSSVRSGSESPRFGSQRVGEFLRHGRSMSTRGSERRIAHFSQKVP